jgi:hypothetical protein
MSGEELQGAVESILASPAFSQILGQLQGKSGGEEAPAPAVPAITPEMMQKLPQMMSALAPLVGGKGRKNPPAARKNRMKEKSASGFYRLCGLI